MSELESANKNLFATATNIQALLSQNDSNQEEAYLGALQVAEFIILAKNALKKGFL